MKNYKYILNRLVIILVLISSVSCVEPIEIEGVEAENLLVVDGIITDQVGVQEIKLSRTYELDENGPVPVSNAEVLVVSSNGESFNFKEVSPGVYNSVIPFGASLGEEYKLQVNLGSTTYESQQVSIESSSEITNISSERTSIRGQDGVVILVSSESNDEEGKYYKYEFEETFKIQSPYLKFKELILDEEDNIIARFKTREEYTCFITVPSQELIITNTDGLVGNSLTNFPVNFIPKDDYKLSYRYSILVKQLEISAEAYAYYETLKNISESENLFSQYQPGFLEGNISNITDSDENVIGFFTVASVAKSRHFFDYTDYFDPEVDIRASHTGNCEPYVPTIPRLIELLREESVAYFSEEPGPVYTVVRKSCVDCTLFGTNVPPEFWTE